MKNPKNVIFPLSFSKILCIIDVAWGGENLLESIWSFRVFSSNMPIDPQEMGSCCKFDCCGDLGHPNPSLTDIEVGLICFQAVMESKVQFDNVNLRKATQ